MIDAIPRTKLQPVKYENLKNSFECYAHEVGLLLRLRKMMNDGVKLAVVDLSTLSVMEVGRPERLSRE